MTSKITSPLKAYIVTGVTQTGYVHIHHPAIKAGQPYFVCPWYAEGYTTIYPYFYSTQRMGSTNGSGYIYVRDVNGNYPPDGINMAFVLVA